MIDGEPATIHMILLIEQRLSVSTRAGLLGVAQRIT